MEFQLHRRFMGKDYTIGEILINGKHYCDTLEDAVRDLKPDGSGKIKHETAISKGRYKVIINKSNRFKRDMPLLIDVPYFEGIRIHSGNTKQNTSGCILLGRNTSKGKLTMSKECFNDFFERLKKELKTSDCYIAIW